MNTASQVMFNSLGVQPVTNIEQSKIIDIMLYCVLQKVSFDDMLVLLNTHLKLNVLNSDINKLIRDSGSNYYMNLLAYNTHIVRMYALLSTQLALNTTYNVSDYSKAAIVSALEVEGKTRQAFSKKILQTFDAIGELLECTILQKAQGDTISILIMKNTDINTMLTYLKDSGFQSPNTVDKLCLKYMN